MIDKSDNNVVGEHDLLPEKNNKPPKARGVGFALFIALLALFFTAAGIAAGYKHWQRMSDRAKGNARKIEAIETALPSKVDGQTLAELNTEISQRIAEHQTTAEKQLRDMAQMQTQTSQFAKTVTSQVEQITALQSRLQQEVKPETGQEWQFAEVVFLLRLALRELNLSNNRDAALGALKAADQRLSEIAPVSYLAVRQQIARDISALNAMAIVDMAVLSGKIDGLLHELRPEAVSGKPAEASNTDSGVAVRRQETTSSTAAESANVNVKDNSSGSLWSGYKQKALDSVSKVVVVRQIDKPLVTTLDTDAQQHLFQLLQLRLENLRLLALQANNHAYHAQIALLRTTLHDYYGSEQALQWLAVLDELDAINLQPEHPDISGSLHQLEQARQVSLAQGQQ